VSRSITMSPAEVSRRTLMVSTLQVAGLVDASCGYLIKDWAENMEIKRGLDSRV